MKALTVLFLLLPVMTTSGQTRDYAKAPKAKALHLSNAQMAATERAIQPYVARARQTYPAAKKRFVAGLPPKYIFSLTTKLSTRSRTRFEVVLVAADSITNGTVKGRLFIQPLLDIGYRFGDPISFPESKIIDWTIVHRDGSLEGNVVGKFLDTYKPR